MKKAKRLSLKAFKPFLLVGIFYLVSWFIVPDLVFNLLKMGLWGFVVLGAFMIAARHIEIEKFRKFIERIFGKKLSLSLSIALNIFSFFEANLKSIFLSFYLKGNCKRLIKTVAVFPVIVFIHAVSAAEEIAKGLFLKKKGMGILILSAPKHSGKTACAARLIRDLRNDKVKIGGVLSPGYFENGQRSFFEALDIATGQKVLLSRRKKTIFVFYRQGLHFCRRVFKNCLKENYDLIIFDEIGPFELKGGGHFSSLQEVLDQADSCLLLIVREGLVGAVAKKFGLISYKEFHLEDYACLLNTCLASRGRRGAELNLSWGENLVLNSSSF